MLQERLHFLNCFVNFIECCFGLMMVKMIEQCLGYCGNYILYLILRSSVYPRLFWVLGDRTITGMFWN